MSFVANVKADFKALPQRFRSGAMPKFIVLMNLGWYLLLWVAIGMEGKLDDAWVVLVLIIAPLYLITTYLVLSQRLKIPLTVVLGLWVLWLGFMILSKGLPDDPEAILALSSAFLSPAINILFLWTWVPKYRVGRWKFGSPVSSSGVSEEQLYAAVWAELESGNIHQGLWAKLWAANKGNEEKTKAAYLKERVSQLLNEDISASGSSGRSPGKSIQEPGRITVPCHHCRAAVRIPEGKSGYVRCPKCDRRFFIQAKTDSKPDVEAERAWSGFGKEAADDIFKQGRGAFRKATSFDQIARYAKIVAIIATVGVIGYYLVVPNTSTKKASTPVARTVPMPYSGSARQYFSGYTPRPIKLTIKTSGSKNYFIKWSRPNQKDALFDVFIRAGNIEVVKVPVGRFELRWATGENWYGYDKLFGTKTQYSTANKVFNYKNDYTYSITLYSVSDGNLSTRRITPDKF